MLWPRAVRGLPTLVDWRVLGECRTARANVVCVTSIRTPLAGIYPFRSPEPAGAVVLHDGNVAVRVGDEVVEAPGKLWLSVEDGLDVRWSVDLRLPLGPVELLIDRPELGRSSVAGVVSNTGGTGYVPGAGVGDSSRLSRVVVHWFNLPAILPAEPLEIPGGSHAGRWVCEAMGWKLIVDKRPDHTAAVEEARGTAIAVFTHVADLERVDGAKFTSQDAKRVLYGWQVALSFATGRWVAPALPVGLDADGKRVWEEWGSWRCSRYHGYFRWWDTIRSQDLGEFCRAFFEHWLDPRCHDALRYTAHHSICASSDQATLEAKVMLAQAGFEYLAWVTNVLEGGRSAGKYKALSTDEKLSEMLDDAGISKTIPAEFGALSALAPIDKQSGPKAITWLRNRLVHPKDAGEPYRVESALAQCWMLSVEYLDLLLLHRLGYRGQYLPRRSDTWAHASVAVPWASGEGWT